MKPMIPQLILNTPVLHRICLSLYEKVFFVRNHGRFYGVFNSLDEAKKCIGSERPSNYGDSDLTEININSFMQIHLFDYPVILHILMLNQIKSIIDFGGHIGVKYYAYKRLLPSINEFTWKVVDVSFCVERGRKEALRRGINNLFFSSDISEAGECDLLLISGALQYVTPSLGQILDNMVSLPHFIIINKLPVHLGPDYYTIENFGKAKIPYRIFNRIQFDIELVNRKYIKVDTWSISSRDIIIPFYEKRLDKFAMEGQFWEKDCILEPLAK